MAKMKDKTKEQPIHPRPTSAHFFKRLSLGESSPTISVVIWTSIFLGVFFFSSFMVGSCRFYRAKLNKKILQWQQKTLNLTLG